jgi:hypothetical protein
MPKLAQIAGVAVVLTGAICAADDVSSQVMYSAGPVGLAAGRSTIVLRRAPGTNEKVGLRAVLDHLKAGEHMVLIVSDFQTDQPPGTIYDLFLNMPRDPPSNETDGYFVGSINFFGASPRRRKSAPNPVKRDRRGRFTSFDVTEAMRRMAKQGDLPETPSITIIPSGPPAAGAHPVIGHIELVLTS